MIERIVTNSPYGKILTGANPWSPDGNWLVYDVRSDRDGTVFDGDRIERVNIQTGEVQTLYEAKHGAKVGVAICDPVQDRIFFIHGPEHPTPDWSYGMTRRQGAILDLRTGRLETPDARDLVPPFTPGALRGGSHVHQWDAKGEWLSFTYEDEVLAVAKNAQANHRTVAVSVPGRPVAVPPGHPRNHDGSHFTVVVAETVDHPTPGSDQINRAFEEGWVAGRRSLAFLGQCVLPDGSLASEVFCVDLPEDPTKPGAEPLSGTHSTRPAPPLGCVQRRLTSTGRGVSGPRHWVRSSPDGGYIAFLLEGQIALVSPDGGPVRRLTAEGDVESGLSWTPDGQALAHLRHGQVCLSSLDGSFRALTTQPLERLPIAISVSPNGQHVASLVRLNGVNQISVVSLT